MTVDGLWDFVAEPATLAVLLATALLAWPVGRRIAGRFRCPRAAAVLLVVAVGVVVALTLTPSRPAPGVVEVLPPHYLTEIGKPRLVWARLTGAPSDAEQVANIALYVPIGLLGVFVRRSALRATLFGLALTVVIETCQYGIIGRAGSLTDIRNNTAGVLVGAVVAAGVLRGVSRTSRAGTRRAGQRRGAPSDPAR
jgi:glycopeptide antibiotics resistance protein